METNESESALLCGIVKRLLISNKGAENIGLYCYVRVGEVEGLLCFIEIVLSGFRD